MYSRRKVGKLAAAACAAKYGLAAKIDSKVGGVQLGVQSYSFRDLSLDAAIAAMKEIGIGECELYMGHVEPAGLKGEQLKNWRLATPLSHFKEIRSKFDHAGIDLYAYSLNFNDQFSDEELDRGFQMTKALGTDIITTSTTLTCAKRLAPLAEKYKVKLAMHGHDETSDPNQFATPQSFARGLAMSPQFYINLDIGHFVAGGYDPVSYIEEHHSKILALHIKDRKKNHGPAVPFGQGDTPIKPVLLLIKHKRYPIPANIEYEYGDDQPGLIPLPSCGSAFNIARTSWRRLVFQIVAGAAVCICVLCAMASYATAHAQIGFTPKALACRDRSVTCSAFRVRVEMSLVTKLDKTGDLVDANPRDRLVFIDVGLQIFNRRAVLGNLHMTAHAAFACRNRNNFAGRS